MIKKDKSFDALRKNCTKTVEAGLVPSRDEFNAFIYELGINKSNYNTSLGLSIRYWTSSRQRPHTAFDFRSNSCSMDNNTFNNAYAVRLATTF